MCPWTSSGGSVPSKRRSRPRSLVVVDQRLGLRVVDREPRAHGLLAVVVALDQLGAVDVAAARVLGGSNSTW